MNTHEHIEELAELYALGALDESERARVNLHAGSCRECAARLGEAERFIAETIAEREPSAALDGRMRAVFAPRSAVLPRWGALVAAAFVVGLLPGFIWGAMRGAPSAFDADRASAVAALANSHFSHAAFVPLALDAPKAKVIYGHGAQWRFFIAQTSRAYAVRTRAGKVLGTLHVQNGAAELYVPRDSDTSYELVDGSRPVARVTLR